MGPDGKTSYLHYGAHFTSGSVPSRSFISKPIIQTKPSLGPASSQHALGASLQSLAQPCNARLHTSAAISSLLGTPYFTRAPAGCISSRRHDRLLFLRSPVLQQPGLGFALRSLSSPITLLPQGWSHTQMCDITSGNCLVLKTPSAFTLRQGYVDLFPLELVLIKMFLCNPRHIGAQIGIHTEHLRIPQPEIDLERNLWQTYNFTIR